MKPRFIAFLFMNEIFDEKSITISLDMAKNLGKVSKLAFKRGNKMIFRFSENFQRWPHEILTFLAKFFLLGKITMCKILNKF